MTNRSQVQNPIFDKVFIGAFVEGVVATLSQFANTKVTPDKPIVGTASSSLGEVAGMIGLVSGDFKATLLLTFTEDCALSIIENRLGKNPGFINREVQEAIGDMTNMIYDSARRVLNESGYSFNMSLPAVVVGQFKIGAHGAGPSLAIPFYISGDKKFFVEFSVE